MTHYDPQDVSDFLDVRELDDSDDPMTVHLVGPCSVCRTPVDADGLCAQGHDDLDRADAAQPGTRAAVMTQAEALARLLAAGAVGVVDVEVTAGRLNHPHDDACPGCGAVAWDVPGDPQQCAACGTRICPVCGADFAEDYAGPNGTRTSDNLGDHLRRWHAEVAAEAVADTARALGLSDAEADALCREAGIDPETGDPR